MMSLKQQLTDDMKQAMRDKDSVKLGAIRFLISDIRNFEIDNGEQDDAGVQKIIAKQVKQMKDAVKDFGTGGRTDLVDAEEQKIKILEAYLPQQMTDSELEAIITQVIAQRPGEKMGQVMSAVMAQVAGRADGGRVSQLVKQKLG